MLQAIIAKSSMIGTVSNATTSPGAGSYASTQSVTFAATGSDKIYYTNDGSTTPVCPDPVGRGGTTTGTLYSGAISTASTTTYKVIGCGDHLYSSTVQTFTYTISAGVTWTLVQHPTSFATHCGSGACAVTVSSTTAGNLLVVLVSTWGLNAGLQSTAVSGDGTWTHAGASWPNDWNYFTTNYNSTDVHYRLSATGGATTITVTPTWNSGATSQATDVMIREYHRSTGTASFDAGGVTANGAGQNACTSCAGPSVTLTGSADVCVQWGASNRVFSAIDSSYANLDHEDTDVQGASADNVAVSSYSVPNWTISSATTTGFNGGAVCFK